MSYFKTAAIAFALVLSFAGGFYTNGLRYESKINAYLAQAETEKAAAIEQVRTTEQNAQKALNEKIKLASNNADFYRNEYERLLNQAGTADRDNVPGSPATPAGDSPDTSNRCPKDNGAKFQRLYRQQLNVAKECDVQLAYCSEFVKFYQGLTQ